MSSLLGLDWCEAWRERYEERPRAGDSKYWDVRSRDFKEHAGTSAYSSIFLEYLSLEPEQSVLDMGCGSGALAIPLARAGHSVIAADFSEGMRQVTSERAQEEGLSNLQIKELDWQMDWKAQGIAPKCVDVAIASRSTIVPDLADALMKLDRVARHKVAITMTTEYSPRGYREGSRLIKGREPYLPDCIYGLNILFQLGAYPELRYIDTMRGNGGKMEDKLVRWAFLSWKPITQG